MSGWGFLRRLIIAWALALSAHAESLVIATYNVQNYLLADRRVDGVFREAYPKTEEAKRALRATIRALDADVLALQEMGARPFLEELRRDLAREGLDYPHAEWLEGEDTERHVAVLSRRPFAAVHGHTDLTFDYFGRRAAVKRGLLEVRIATSAGELALFVVHLKSRLTERVDDPESARRRAAEATAIRDRILRQFPQPSEAAFMLLGDFNDTRGSRPLRACLQRGRTDVAEIVPAADTRGETWTHHYRKEDVYSRVDFILVSPGLRTTWRVDEGRVADGANVATASDHRPVSVRLVATAVPRKLGEKP